MKSINVVLMSLMFIGLVAGCGGASGSGSSSSKISGETYSTDAMSVLVPTGWKAFPFYKNGNVDDVNPNEIGIHKGAKEAYDMSHTPGMTLYFRPNQSTTSFGKTYYEDVADMEPFTTGDLRWEGFTGKMQIGYGDKRSAVAAIWTSVGNDMFQAFIWLEMDDSKITLNDADVKTILASIVKK